MVLKAEHLDADPYALCTPAGIVDLHTGLLRTPDPNKDFHSRSTSVGPAVMPIPRFQRFLADTFGDDADGTQMINFLQLLLGYSITGDVGGQVMPFLFGAGKNGKSVLLDVSMKLLGDYADAAPPFLMARLYEGHPTDLAELHGRRVVVCSEVKPGDKFDEARVKHLTGGDRIKARRMRQDFFSFNPTHKLWLLGNHRPEVGTGGFAFWRRMRLIPRAHRRRRPPHRQSHRSPRRRGRPRHPQLAHRRRPSLPRRREGPHRPGQSTHRHQRLCRDRGSPAASSTRPASSTLTAAPNRRRSTTPTAAGASERPAHEQPNLRRPSPRASRPCLPKEMILSNSRKYYPGIGLLANEETA
ncbi:phage/plasmid primase, P4 family [Streptomyces zhihengii]